MSSSPLGAPHEFRDGGVECLGGFDVYRMAGVDADHFQVGQMALGEPSLRFEARVALAAHQERRHAVCRNPLTKRGFGDGVADRVGSLEPGKDADIVVFSGHPFDYRTVAELVIVNGEVAHQRS